MHTLAAPISLGTPRPLAARRPRFRRDDPPPIRLTDDDIAIIRHVAEHRFLRSTHVITLLDRPAKKILERLAALYHNAYACLRGTEGERSHNGGADH